MIIVTAAHCFAYYVLSSLPIPIPEFAKVFLLASAVTVFLTLVVSIWWKISIHMIGIGGLLGAVAALSIKFVADQQLIIMGLVLIAGLIAYSRLFLNAHNPSQVYSGLGLGIASMLTLIMIL